MLSQLLLGFIITGFPLLAQLIFPLLKLISRLIFRLNSQEDEIKFTYLSDYYQRISQNIHLPSSYLIYSLAIIRIQQLKMNKQYSSKEYPKIVNLQGRQLNSLEVTIQGKLKEINSRDFFELTQIVNLKISSQLKAQSFYSIISNSNSITILHIFIYYCIKVTQSVQIEGIDSHYLKILADLYINSGFNIEINRYAHLISKTTSITLRKCIHILYYLLYGRLASNSYVNSIISQLAPKSQNKRQRLKMILSSKMINKKQPTLLSQSELQEGQKNTQCDQLVKDLRQIFSKDVKEKDQKTKFRQWLISDQKQSQDQQNGWNKQRGLKNLNFSNKKSERKYYLNFFPNRVFNDEKSAVLEQIVPNLKSNYKLMRKRKFDDSKIQKMLYMTFNNGFKQEKQEQKKEKQLSLAKQRSKIFTHNIIKMNEKFKSTSSELDKIRYLITQGGKKRSSNQPPYEKTEVLSLIQKEYFELIENKENKQEKQQKMQPQTFSTAQYQGENTLVNLLRKEQKKNNSTQKDSQIFASKQTENPKLFNSCRSAFQSKGANKIVHSLCQNRVHKYKNQYRKFMKLHLFHQNDENR